MAKAKNARDLNGYRVVYAPAHPTAMRSENWRGYVYEHIYVAERALNRRLGDDEVVHHLDGDRRNNCSTNLLVLMRSQHAKLHAWLNAGAPFAKANGAKVANSGKAKATEPRTRRSSRRCKTCEAALQPDNRTYCSIPCRDAGTRVVDRPTKSELRRGIQRMSFLALGRRYGVSDNTVRKWARRYGLLGQP